ncbi:ABC transporter substrate-binding protein [Motiliproteus sp. MSK22-1]|uniref:ABC transporter substrate-binding protein n=1 Tax=Motiliproteus sp. MSK22-1 TaxID=1897630 RepID=UPI000975DA55|nr:ABC transporter substrate-binding protein [Motiliproteus sp. MSK22-1]OMH39620.1 hypothetical protein BGP75_01875 [Motiliproteus sp. MSK22-1]
MNTSNSSFRRSFCRILMLLSWMVISAPSWSQNVIKVAVLKYGTVNWELSTMVEEGFDQQNGFSLKVQPLAGMTATRTALLGGSADVIVADWMWVSRQRDKGHQLQFIPYSSSVGKLMLAKDSSVKQLADLQGKKVGIAGGPTSKGWLLLRALGKQQGIDLKAITEQQYGAPPLLNAALEQGRIDAVVTFWHYAARLEGQGYPALHDLKQVSQLLGMKSELPMLGYVFHQKWAEDRPDLVTSLQAASRQSKDFLQQQPNAWQRLRPMMKAESDSVFRYLREGYLAGTPSPLVREQITDAEQMFSLLAQLGGKKLVGDSRTLNQNTFWQQP